MIRSIVKLITAFAGKAHALRFHTMREPHHTSHIVAISWRFVTLAIQEPYFNEQARTTYCPPEYALCYQAVEGTRVCFLVSKRICSRDWSFYPTHGDVATLTVQTSVGSIALVNVYNPTPTFPQSRTPSRLLEITAALDWCYQKNHIRYSWETSTFTTPRGEASRAGPTYSLKTYSRLQASKTWHSSRQVRSPGEGDRLRPPSISSSPAPNSRITCSLAPVDQTGRRSQITTPSRPNSA